MKSNDQILEYMGKRPQIHESVFLAPGSQVIGDVVIGKNSSIWFQTLVRGDVNYIRIGENVNIQDLTIIHVARDVYPVEIGNNVSIGHRATIHGCKLKDNSFVGMCATLMDDVEVGEFAFIGAGALVTPGKKFLLEFLLWDLLEKSFGILPIRKEKLLYVQQIIISNIRRIICKIRFIIEGNPYKMDFNFCKVLYKNLIEQ